MTTQPFEFHVGEDVYINFSPAATQTAKNITGWSLRIDVRATRGGILLFQLTVANNGIVIVDAANGIFYGFLTDVQTATLSPSPLLWFELWRTDTPHDTVLAEGPISVLAG